MVESNACGQYSQITSFKSMHVCVLSSCCVSVAEQILQSLTLSIGMSSLGSLTIDCGCNDCVLVVDGTCTTGETTTAIKKILFQFFKIFDNLFVGSTYFGLVSEFLH